MSVSIRLTEAPVQITDGTNSANITIGNGNAVYADSENSEAWHPASGHIYFGSPWVIWMKAVKSVAGISTADIVVSYLTE
ncbi:hypothetical protein [Pantoea sp. BAV 3049]|uniref:hypothetical protein n=1 Tax=Pantoea sp. BAV 3049 TaxID=2654188 RepID=UPI00131BE1D3|nr:hypothetical protein [Pantoea sp. BAV 3049]